MLFPNGRILIFAKAPVPGRCKTRLAAGIGNIRAARVYRQLLEHNLATAVGSNLAPVQLWCAPDTSHPFFHHCRRRWRIRLCRQSGGDLGQRMHHALRRSLRQARFALIIGGDCPVLSAEHLDDALTALDEGDDAVFAPTSDGGYALVGGRQAPRALFHGIAWGGPRVMQQTRRRLKHLDMRWTRLPTLWDVDDREDYIRAARNHHLR